MGNMITDIEHEVNRGLPQAEFHVPEDPTAEDVGQLVVAMPEVIGTLARFSKWVVPVIKNISSQPLLSEISSVQPMSEPAGSGLGHHFYTDR